jgi:hypothetical protein
MCEDDRKFAGLKGFLIGWLFEYQHGDGPKAGCEKVDTGYLIIVEESEIWGFVLDVEHGIVVEGPEEVVKETEGDQLEIT